MRSDFSPERFSNPDDSRQLNRSDDAAQVHRILNEPFLETWKVVVILDDFAGMLAGEILGFDDEGHTAGEKQAGPGGKMGKVGDPFDKQIRAQPFGTDFRDRDCLCCGGKLFDRNNRDLAVVVDLDAARIMGCATVGFVGKTSVAVAFKTCKCYCDLLLGCSD